MVLEAVTDLHPVLKRVYANRGITAAKELSYDLAQLLPYYGLLGIQTAARCIADAVMQDQSILIIGDYDADGATSTAVALLALKKFRAKRVDFLVPNRFEYGYGLTPEIVELAAQKHPDILITVDNGIASIAGVARANALGMRVIITDHHLAGEELPQALAIVNPNQPGDKFASKCIAGVGVIFYVMLAVRTILRERKWFVEEPNMASLLDCVALGTIADVVPLDYNNRILVHQGLRRVRAGYALPGIKALLKIAGREEANVVASDFGFAVGPRLNAAGRLEDMSTGIRCLIGEETTEVLRLATQLDQLNQERKQLEKEMREQASADLGRLQLSQKNMPHGLCVYDERWHQGVIGILAARIKEEWHRPVIAFSKVSETELKGSARSIEGFHIRDALDTLSKKHPALIQKFGGHAMAAGLSLHPNDFPTFKLAFEELTRECLAKEVLTESFVTDGHLSKEELSKEVAMALRFGGPWGQRFPEPLFEGEFILLDQRLVGEKHLKCFLQLPSDDRVLEAMAFYIDLTQWPNQRCRRLFALYRLDVNRYLGRETIQLILEKIEVREEY